MNKERGNMKFHNNEGLQITQLYDSNVVSIISTFDDSEVEKVKRYIKKIRIYENIELPGIVNHYKVSIGGVDLIDQTISSH